ncbi:MAG: SDR family oxidoreductase [Ilumatobacteraceae bacterium]
MAAAGDRVRMSRRARHRRREGHRPRLRTALRRTTDTMSPSPTSRARHPTTSSPCAATSLDGDAVEIAFTEIEDRLGGNVEVLVANAGVTRDTLLLRMSDDDFATVVDTNLVGTFRVVKRASRAMLRARSGRIILLGSVVGLLGSAGQANYAASKAGLVGFARSLARELGSRSITVNVIAPGATATDMLAAVSEARQAELAAAVPLGRVARPEEIAAVAAFLASDDAAYITGAVIPVDGGLGMGH